MRDIVKSGRNKSYFEAIIYGTSLCVYFVRAQESRLRKSHPVIRRGGGEQENHAARGMSGL